MHPSRRTDQSPGENPQNRCFLGVRGNTDLIGLELENLPVSRRKTPHAQSRPCVYRDIVWSRIALAKDGGGQDRNVPYTCNSGFCLRSLEWVEVLRDMRAFYSKLLN